MNCPTCGCWSHVLSTRKMIYRNRECANGHRFRTEERLVEEEDQLKIAVQKLRGSDGPNPAQSGSYPRTVKT